MSKLLRILRDGTLTKKQVRTRLSLALAKAEIKIDKLKARKSQLEINHSKLFHSLEGVCAEILKEDGFDLDELKQMAIEVKKEFFPPIPF